MLFMLAKEWVNEPCRMKLSVKGVYYSVKNSLCLKKKKNVLCKAHHAQFLTSQPMNCEAVFVTNQLLNR